MKPRPWQIALLLVGSGMSALIYQTVWLRQFRLIFGASTLASAAVLAIFMGGLGLGSVLFGRRVDLLRRPLGFYARLELLVALSAAASPALLWIANQIYRALGGTPALGYASGTLLRLLLSALVLLIPTTLMGGTLPAASRAIETELDLSRRNVALLYGMNTCGAVTGVILSTFVLLERLGNRTTLWVACVVNVAVALAAMVIDRHQSKAESKPQHSEVEACASSAPAWLIFTAVAVSGFAFLLMELVWYRMLTPLLGGTSFTLGLILAVALFGIGLGGLLYAARPESSPATLGTFGVVCALEALAITLPFAAGDGLAVLAVFLRPLGGFGFFGLVWGWFVIAMLVVFPASLVSGYQFPLLIGLLGRGRAAVGRHVGLAYAWNTGGAIVGSLAGGFGLLPLLGATAVWRFVGVPFLALAFVAVLFSRDGSERSGKAFASMLLVLATVWAMSAEGPTAAWRHSPIGAGRVVIPSANPNRIHDWINRRQRVMVWERDGVESSVAIANEDGLAFLINGKSDGNGRYDAGTQVMGGMIGGILHPNPRRALVIGLGTGSTAGWLASIPTMERVDVVELEPAVRQVALACAPVNENVLRNPKVHVYIGDAREVLLTQKQKYDIIFSEPSNPFRAGVASLFTDDFYAAALARLEPGGLFLQWVQAYEIDGTTLRTIYATLTSVFPNVDTWMTMRKDLLLVASSKPVAYDANELRARIERPPFRDALARAWRVHDLEGVLAHYACGDSTARAVAAGATLNTDDRSIIEFAFARSVGDTSLFRPRELLVIAARRGDSLPRMRGRVDEGLVALRRLAVDVDSGSPPLILPRAPVELRRRSDALESYVRGDFNAVFDGWAAQSTPPSDEIELLSIAETLADRGDERFAVFANELSGISPEESDVIQARYLWRKGDRNGSAAALQRAFASYRRNPWPLGLVMSRGLDIAIAISRQDPAIAAQLTRSIQEPFALSLLEEKRKTTLLNIAAFVEPSGCGPLTRAAIAQYENEPLWQLRFLETRLRCADQTTLAAARRDLEAFVELEPPPLDEALDAQR